MTLDHVFICTAAGAPAAAELVEFGLTEGSPNRHTGQGTACRRFFFQNAMLELLWVEDPVEAQSEATRRTRLWERWSDAGREASPFGVILRPDGSRAACPFPSWEYRPTGMPDLVLHIAGDADLDEPMWCYLPLGRRPADVSPERRPPVEHARGFREITGVRIGSPSWNAASLTAAMARNGIISAEAGPEHLLELQFDGARGEDHKDFRPHLPLVFHW